MQAMYAYAGGRAGAVRRWVYGLCAGAGLRVRVGVGMLRVSGQHVRVLRGTVSMCVCHVSYVRTMLGRCDDDDDDGCVCVGAYGWVWVSGRWCVCGCVRVSAR